MGYTSMHTLCCTDSVLSECFVFVFQSVGVFDLCVNCFHAAGCFGSLSSEGMLEIETLARAIWATRWVCRRCVCRSSSGQMPT